MSEVRPVDPDVQRSVTDLYRLIRDVDERVDGIDGGGDSGGGEGGGIPEAPLDGRQYGRQDAAWSVIELDDGEHVLTGDPVAPPADLEVGQLLWDGVEGGGGSGGGGPHDHAEYLPLTGGTLTGALTVDRSLTLASETSNPLMVVNRAGSRIGYFGVPGAQAVENGELWLRGDKELILQGVDGVRVHQSDLQVDGRLTVKGGGTATTPVITFNGIDGMGIYSHAVENWLRFAVGGTQRLNIREDKVIVNNDLQVDGTINGTLAFGIADGIDARDVLDRAEVATMPAVDEEGVATTDAEVESVTVNEVVTALLAKVKELSAEIEELRGA